MNDRLTQPLRPTKFLREVEALAKVLRPALWLSEHPGPATMQERALALSEAYRALEAGYVAPEDRPDSIAERACHHLHAPEWEAPVARTEPCEPCLLLAAALETSPSPELEQLPAWTACDDRPPCRTCIAEAAGSQA